MSPRARPPRGSPAGSSAAGSPGSESAAGFAAELSSLATALDDLSRRVTAIAEGYAGARRDDLATELYQVERALASARRGLAKVVDGHR